MAQGEIVFQVRWCDIWSWDAIICLHQCTRALSTIQLTVLNTRCWKPNDTSKNPPFVLALVHGLGDHSGHMMTVVQHFVDQFGCTIYGTYQKLIRQARNMTLGDDESRTNGSKRRLWSKRSRRIWRSKRACGELGPADWRSHEILGGLLDTVLILPSHSVLMSVCCRM